MILGEEAPRFLKVRFIWSLSCFGIRISHGSRNLISFLLINLNGSLSGFRRLVALAIRFAGYFSGLHSRLSFVTLIASNGDFKDSGGG